MRIRIVMYYKYCKYKCHMRMAMVVFIFHYRSVEFVTAHLNRMESEVGFCIDSNHADDLSLFDIVRVFINPGPG